LETTVIHNWTGPEFCYRDRLRTRETLRLPSDKVILLNVSNDMRRKNVELLPSILNLIPPDYVLVRIGASNRIEHRVGADRLISRTGVPAEAYPLYFNAADLLLMPSRDEGFGLPIIEAVNSGLPIVASDIEVFHEILGEKYPYFAPPDDAERWAQMVREVDSRFGGKPGSPDIFRPLDGYYREDRGLREYEGFFRRIGALS
jgi:glycosyltransferase involved in cell wall biosynthesis